MELQQSPLYARYIEALKWTVIHIDGTQMFYKHIPLAGGLLKIQRPQKLPPAAKLLPIIKKYHVKTIGLFRERFSQFNAECLLQLISNYQI